MEKIKCTSVTVFLMAGWLIAGLVIAIFLTVYCADISYRATAGMTERLVTRYPDMEQEIIACVKSLNRIEGAQQNTNYLEEYGFTRREFAVPFFPASAGVAFFCAAMAVLLVLLPHFLFKRKNRKRIRDLTGYLAEVNAGKEVSILPGTEDDFSILEDEIYKTVTELRLAKETALKERQNFAESLSNIAHQIKTPVTSISVLAQIPEAGREQIMQIKNQASRLGQLTDALLTVSKMDAGVISLEQKRVDVYTVLELAVESLQTQITEKKIEILLPNHQDVFFTGDMDWSVEAFINLIKNSVEHTPVEGRLEFAYERNPLYAEIRQTDSGSGFLREEIGHIFERFYQGTKAAGMGTGIGLSLAKSIIEMQNGFISAENMPDGGACFTIRFYCH